MCPSDLLLLDEPTNHLDLDALVWLEAWLQRYQGTMLVISHDREFLDAVTQVTVHIEQTKLNRYGGNYSKFEDMRAEQMELQQASYAKQQEKIAHLQKFIDRFKAQASKAKQAQSRVKALGRMERIAPLLAEAEFTFEFKEPANLPNPMLAMQEVSFGYPPPADAPAGTPPTVIVKNVSKSVLAGPSAFWAPMAKASPPWSRRLPVPCSPSAARSPKAKACPSATLPSKNLTCCARRTRRWST